MLFAVGARRAVVRPAAVGRPWRENVERWIAVEKAGRLLNEFTRDGRLNRTIRRPDNAVRCSKSDLAWRRRTERMRGRPHGSSAVSICPPPNGAVATALEFQVRARRRTR